MDSAEDSGITLFKTECPACGYKVDAHSPVSESGSVPEAGSVSICLACGAPSIYEGIEGSEGLTLREPTLDEKLEISGNPEIQKMMFTIAYLRATRPTWPRASDQTDE